LNDPLPETSKEFQPGASNEFQSGTLEVFQHGTLKDPIPGIWRIIEATTSKILQHGTTKAKAMIAKPVRVEDTDPLPQNFLQAKSITKKQHSGILTSTPKKLYLEESDKRKRDKEEGKPKIIQRKQKEGHKKKKRVNQRKQKARGGKLNFHEAKPSSLENIDKNVL
jgi:hypothetical protein